MKHNFSAGKYWVGDPCYAVRDSYWSTLGEETGWFGSDPDNENSAKYNGLFYYNGRKCFADGTKYGDGVYVDNKGNKYPVDAGLIGILPLESCDGDYLGGGNIIVFENDFVVIFDVGHFEFGDIIIETDDEEEDFENWDDEDDDDWDDDYGDKDFDDNDE